MKQTTLYYREGGSDKVYQVAVEPRGDGFIVTFAYGRRGSILQTGTKTPEPVSREQALLLFDKLVRDKTAKGYKPGEDGQRFAAAPSSVLDEDTGVRCQLLNPVEEKDLTALLQSRDWCAQEKFDGRRMLIRRVGTSVIGINRRGLRISLPGSFLMAALGLPDDFLLDGEAVGETFHAFDLLEHKGRDIRHLPLRTRLDYLSNLLHGRDYWAIQQVPTARMSWEKEAMFETLRGEKREGIVLKRLDAPYTAGRPNSGGTQRKWKFVETASFLVRTWNGKRSIALELLSDDKRVFAGNVTIPPNHPMPPPSSVVEVRYLYAYRESGSIYQPVYLGLRDDIDPMECKVEQLKFKPESVVPAA